MSLLKNRPNFVNTFVSQEPQKYEPRTLEEKLLAHIDDCMTNDYQTKPARQIAGRLAGFCPTLNVLSSATTMEKVDGPAGKFYKHDGISKENLILEHLTSVFLKDIGIRTFVPEPDAKNYRPLEIVFDEGLRTHSVVDAILKFEDKFICVDVKIVKQIHDKKTVDLDLVELLLNGTLSLENTPQAKKNGAEDNAQYIAQMQWYSALTGIDTCFLLQISRQVIEKFGETFAKKLVPVDTTYSSLLEVTRNAFFSQLCITAGALPEIPTWFRKTKECNYCDFRTFCHNGKQEFTYVTPLTKITDTQRDDFNYEALRQAEIFLDRREQRFNHIKSLKD